MKRKNKKKDQKKIFDITKSSYSFWQESLKNHQTNPVAVKQLRNLWKELEKG